MLIFASLRIKLSVVDELKTKEAIASMPSYEADRQVVCRTKKKNLPDYPPEPKSLSEIEIPDFLKKTLEFEGQNSDNFFFYDSGKDDENRFFIFTTEENLKLLEKSNCFADGTFSVAPNLFYQVYTIHAFVNGRCIPLVYCLLPRKTEEIYIRVLTAISTKLNRFPISITTDFEKAFINSIKKIFPSTKIHGCFFHFKQAVWRKI
ncbi:unnamed protein product, partial [Brachionus calyciflorus]